MRINAQFAALAAMLAVPLCATAQPSALDPIYRAYAAAQAIPDTPGDGPFPATVEVDPGLPGFVIYRPADLAALGTTKLGVLVWGNGACTDDGTAQRFELAEIASYGYLVIAPGGWRSGPAAKDPPRDRPPPGVILPPATSPQDLTHALDWALAENLRSGSRYHGLIDDKAVAAGGYSCGGLQAISIAGDPRLHALLIQNSGIFTVAPAKVPGLLTDKGLLERFHTPVLYLLGGESDIAWPQGTDDFARLTSVPAVMVNLPTGHIGTFFDPMGGKGAGIAVDWLQWQLRNDGGAARTFLGVNCRLCTDAGASVELKNFR